MPKHNRKQHRNQKRTSSGTVNTCVTNPKSQSHLNPKVNITPKNSPFPRFTGPFCSFTLTSTTIHTLSNLSALDLALPAHLQPHHTRTRSNDSFLHGHGERTKPAKIPDIRGPLLSTVGTLLRLQMTKERLEDVYGGLLDVDLNSQLVEGDRDREQEDEGEGAKQSQVEGKWNTSTVIEGNLNTDKGKEKEKNNNNDAMTNSANYTEPQNAGTLGSANVDGTSRGTANVNSTTNDFGTSSLGYALRSPIFALTTPNRTKFPIQFRALPLEAPPHPPPPTPEPAYLETQELFFPALFPAARQSASQMRARLQSSQPTEIATFDTSLDITGVGPVAIPNLSSKEPSFDLNPDNNDKIESKSSLSIPIPSASSRHQIPTKANTSVQAQGVESSKPRPTPNLKSNETSSSAHSPGYPNTQFHHNKEHPIPIQIPIQPTPHHAHHLSQFSQPTKPGELPPPSAPGNQQGLLHMDTFPNFIPNLQTLDIQGLPPGPLVDQQIQDVHSRGDVHGLQDLHSIQDLRSIQDILGLPNIFPLVSPLTPQDINAIQHLQHHHAFLTKQIRRTELLLDAQILRTLWRGSFWERGVVERDLVRRENDLRAQKDQRDYRQLSSAQ